MQIKIKAVDGISLSQQLQVVQDYIRLESENGKPKITPKDWGVKIRSGIRNYHIKVYKTRTMWVFNIWWAT